MLYTIYKITNLTNSKVYIGKHQTEDVDDDYVGSGKLIKRAIEKYGVDNFRKEVLFIFNSEAEMNSKEAELVTEEFCARDDTYNICPGGQGGFGYINSSGANYKGFEAQRELAISAAKTSNAILQAALKVDPVLYNKWRNSLIDRQPTFKGRTHTDDTRKSIGFKNSIHQAGSGNSQYGTCWITNGRQNAKIRKCDTIPVGWYRGRVIK